jgi:hypothetical protein
MDNIPIDEQIIVDDPNPQTVTVVPDEPVPPYEVTSVDATKAVDSTSPATDLATAPIANNNLGLDENIATIHNYAITQFLSVPETDTSDIATVKRNLVARLTIDTEKDNGINSLRKQFTLFTLQGIDNIAKVYGVPIEEFGEKVTYKPQVKLIFQEIEINQEDTPVRERKLVKRISFRLFGENIPKNIDDLASLRQKIIDSFSGVSWLASKDKTFTYRDVSKGYRFAVDAEREVFIDLITKVLAIQGDTFEEKYVGIGEVNRPVIPPTANVLGRTVNLPFRGRWGTVYFLKAEYKQAGIDDKILATNIPLNTQ